MQGSQFVQQSIKKNVCVSLHQALVVELATMDLRDMFEARVSAIELWLICDCSKCFVPVFFECNLWVGKFAVCTITHLQCANVFNNDKSVRR